LGLREFVKSILKNIALLTIIFAHKHRKNTKISFRWQLIAVDFNALAPWYFGIFAVLVSKNDSEKSNYLFSRGSSTILFFITYNDTKAHDHEA